MNIMDSVTGKTTLKKVSSSKGGEWAGPCPGCGGKDRFRVWPVEKGGEGSFWCRGCQKGGDHVQFLVDFCGMAYRDAFKAVGRERPAGYKSARYQAVNNTGNGFLSQQQTFTPRHFDAPLETWQLRAEKLVNESHETLLEMPTVLGWLADRGLDLAAVKAFRLGWFPGEKGKPCTWRPRTTWGLDEIRKSNGRLKMLWIPRGVVIPWISDGKVMRIKIRRPGRDLNTDRDVKYYFLPGSSSEPALINPDRKAFVIVESELDGLLVARKAGTLVGCLILGSAANKPGALAYKKLKQSIKILDALDFDEAGTKAGDWWKTMFTQAVRWPVPVGKDPGEAFAGGVDIFSWITTGLPPALTMDLKKSGLPVNENVPVHSPQESPGNPPQTNTPMAMEPENNCHGSSNKNYPPGVLELRTILMKYPIKIVATTMRTAVITTPEWKETDVYRRASQLVFSDFPTLDFLEAHPNRTIHRGNFDQGAAA